MIMRPLAIYHTGFIVQVYFKTTSFYKGIEVFLQYLFEVKHEYVPILWWKM